VTLLRGSGTAANHSRGDSDNISILHSIADNVRQTFFKSCILMKSNGLRACFAHSARRINQAAKKLSLVAVYDLCLRKSDMCFALSTIDTASAAREAL